MKQKKQNRIPVIVHPGYPKTASTTLQKHYFHKIGGLDYVGKHYGKGERWKYGLAPAVKHLIVADEDRLAEQGDEFRQALREAYDGRPLLISEERILGSIITPRVDDYGLTRRSNAYAVARAIRRLFSEELFDVRIVLSIRAQAGLLPSKYAQSFAQTYAHIPRLKTFDRFVGDILESDDSFLRPGLNYLTTVNAFEEVFGGEHVLLLPFELIQSDLGGALEAFMSFSGLDPSGTPAVPEGDGGPRENVKSTGGGAYRYKKVKMFHLLSRFKRRYFPNWTTGKDKIVQISKKIRPPLLRNPGTVRMTPERKQQIRDLYESSNRELSERHVIDLGQYGYF